jgi:hypothetical protein
MKLVSSIFILLGACYFDERILKEFRLAPELSEYFGNIFPDLEGLTTMKHVSLL